MAGPCVLIVADPARIAELASALAEPIPQGALEVLVSSGGDDTIDLFSARKPEVVVLTAGLELGDSKSLIETLRGMVPSAEVSIVVVGDDAGPIRTAIDATELAPDKFVTRPLVAKALRFAVSASLDAVKLTRPRTTTDRGTGFNGTTPAPISDDPTSRTRAALRARWEALADSIVDEDPSGELDSEAAPLPPPIVIQPRRQTVPDLEAVPLPQAWRPGGTAPVSIGSDDPTPAPPAREPTLIINEPPPARPHRSSDPPGNVVVTERTTGDRWSEPTPLAELVDRDSARDLAPNDELDDFDEEIVVGHGAQTPPPHVLRGGELRQLDDLVEQTPPPVDDRSGGRDFARQLRAKMSMMAQRLFQGDSARPAAAVDVGPRHDHQTEIDLASLGEEVGLGGGVTEIEARMRAPEARELTTSPGSWDTQVRERGLPETGEIVRGVSDAALLLAKMYAQSATGRVGFRKDGPEAEWGGLTPTRVIEKIVYFDAGRPVFASSNEVGDRMGELLVREGKITAAQYERCQVHVEQSGRRMGEILVDFGYLKRRELLPAVRRHVEDILYSLFGWDRGHYHITLEDVASAERIRLSRHPASLVLEGIRRKHDRSTLQRLLGSASTVIEVTDRERLSSIVQTGDLANEERAALVAFDGQADLAQVARTTGVDVVDVLPLAWGLCVLGLATARRAEADVVDESTALVGETDLAIDRERVRARWQLVSEADYFALLGVRRDATAFEIRRAYQSARRDFAADCFPNDLRRELAQELDDIASVLDEAFRVLRDDRLRLTYLSNLVE